MTFERRIATLFRMDDATWRRHANPWSVWTRATVLPLLVLAAWSRVWLGWWALVPGALVVAWAWLNPRLFGEPASFEHWSSGGVFGERVWMARDRVPVPPHHRSLPHWLSAVSVVGLATAAWGVAALQAWPAVLGTAIAMLGKLWFVDRMAWLYADVREERSDADA